jgi:hypothetical protein
MKSLTEYLWFNTPTERAIITSRRTSKSWCARVV